MPFQFFCLHLQQFKTALYMNSDFYAYISIGVAVLVALLFLLSMIIMDMSKADIERLCKKRQKNNKHDNQP